MNDGEPITDAQQKFILDALSDIETYVHGVEACLNDLGRDFVVLKELLEEKSVITCDEFAEHLEKMEKDVCAAQIVQQNRTFFDELRQRLKGE